MNPYLSVLDSVQSQRLFFKRELKSQASVRAIRGCDAATMEHDSMLDYGQTQTGTALAAGAAFIDSIESLEKSCETLFINPDTVILEDDSAEIVIVFRQCNMDSLAFRI